MTISLLQQPVDHPQIQAFVERSPAVFAAAEQHGGLLHTFPNPEWANWKAPALFQPEVASGRVSVTLTLWRNLESVFAFACHGPHAEALTHRRQWFTLPLTPLYAAWWVTDDHMPTWDEASARFEKLQQSGPTPEAFDFKHPFNAEGQPVPRMTKPILPEG